MEASPLREEYKMSLKNDVVGNALLASMFLCIMILVVMFVSCYRATVSIEKMTLNYINEQHLTAGNVRCGTDVCHADIVKDDKIYLYKCEVMEDNKFYCGEVVEEQHYSRGLP